jgi:hypothetical protein
MIFAYRSIISAAPDGGDYLLILRPEIPVTIIGPGGSATYIGLVDTGSDNTILPKSIADDLGIPVEPMTGPAASVFGRHRVQLLAGQAKIKLDADGESFTWPTELFFFDFEFSAEETVILGHASFLDYFTATFDGEQGIPTLVPSGP